MGLKFEFQESSLFAKDVEFMPWSPPSSAPMVVGRPQIRVSLPTRLVLTTITTGLSGPTTYLDTNEFESDEEWFRHSKELILREDTLGHYRSRLYEYYIVVIYRKHAIQHRS